MSFTSREASRNKIACLVLSKGNRELASHLKPGILGATSCQLAVVLIDAVYGIKKAFNLCFSVTYIQSVSFDKALKINTI
jgi:hypothetical protein